MFSKASARQNLCCKYREFWRELSSTHSVEHPSGMFTPRIIFVMLEFFFYYYTLQKALRAFQSCFDFIGQALILQIMHWFYRSCTDFIGQKIKFYTAAQDEEHLFPNPHTCPMLRQVNRAAIVDGINLPDLKEDRLEIEKALGLYTSQFLSFLFSFSHLIFLSLMCSSYFFSL